MLLKNIMEAQPLKFSFFLFLIEQLERVFLDQAYLQVRLRFLENRKRKDKGGSCFWDPSSAMSLRPESECWKEAELLGFLSFSFSMRTWKQWCLLCRKQKGRGINKEANNTKKGRI
jgi:hypothetical protein